METTAGTRDWGVIATPVRTAIDPGAPPWKDNAWLGWWAPDSDAFGLVHAASSPNAEGRKISFSVSVEGRSFEVLEDLPLGGGHPGGRGGGFSGGQILFDIDGRFRVDSPRLQADLVVEPRLEVVDYTPGQVVPPLIPNEPIHHYQRSGYVRGSVILDGVEHSIDGVGFRDRTFGFRSEAAHLVEYWAVLACFPSFDLTAMKFLDADGEHRIDGFVVYPDATQVTVRGIEVARDSNALTHDADITLQDGRTLSVVNVARSGGHWLPMVGGRNPGPSFSVYEEFDRFVVDDDEQGWGLVEHAVLRRLH